MVRQGALTIITPIESGKLPSLKNLLVDIEKNDVPDNSPPTDIPFRKLSTIHFARWVILEKEKDKVWEFGEPFGPLLVFSTNYDGTLSAHLDQLVKEAKNGLDQIYRHCKNYLGENKLKEYLESHQSDYEAFYNGHPLRPVQQIKDEKKLREAIQLELDSWVREGSLDGQSSVEIRKKIQSFVSGKEDLKQLLEAPAEPFNYKMLFFGIGLGIAFLLIGASLLGFWVEVGLGILSLIILAIIWFVILQSYENKDPEVLFNPDLKHIGGLAGREDKIGQNQMTALVDIKKPGWLRYTTIKLVLGIINLAAKYLFNKGRLADIPSIHFARWIIIDKRHLVFFSNYDGSWENYLGDFIDKASMGLTAIWSNCIKYPRTRFLVCEGATNEHLFKFYVRVNQVETDVWYSAYQDLTVLNINHNTQIRAGLSGTMNDAQAREWLKLF